MKERRKEPRKEAEGAVTLSWSAPFPVDLEGQLADISAGGFRAVHGSAALETGQVVHFRHQYGEGSARVAWTRLSGGRIESGFMVLTD